MLDIIPPLSPLTRNVATNELQAEGLDALGLTVPTLSPAWASTTPNVADYDAEAMTLALTNMRAPFRAILTLEESAGIWSHASGSAIAGPLAVLRLHPEAARRLERLMAERYGDPLIYPVPTAMVLREVTPPDSGIVANWFLAGETLRWNVDGAPANFGNATISFHDSRGLIIDPIAVAAMFADLMGHWPALRMSPPGNALDESDAGGLDGITALASGVRCQVIDLHGWAYATTRDEARLKIIDSEANEIAVVADGGLFDWEAGQELGRAADDDPDPPTEPEDPPLPPKPLYWGWATNGTLERNSLSLPGIALSRQFLRVMAVNLNWHLLGNRTGQAEAGIPSDDNLIPDFALPQVRQAVPNFEYLVDGMAVLTEASEMAEIFEVEMGEESEEAEDFKSIRTWAIAVSPVINPTLDVPSGRWPAFPIPDTGTMLTPGTNPTQGLVGRRRNENSQDVIITLPANAVPDGTHVRVFPRQFVEIRAIGEQPSFVRGDGGSAIALNSTETKVLLTNPFSLPEDAPAMLDPARLEVDIVLTSRSGQRRLFSVVAVVVDGSEFWEDNHLFGGQPLLSTESFADLFTVLSSQSIAPTPVFGISDSLQLSQPNESLPPIIRLARRLASEEQPRQGPRLPTQARFETIFALGEGDESGEDSDAPLQWNAILTGARWDWESRSAQPELGNPGNPAGPDIHAAGIRCDGQLAYDLALHGMKRSQSIVPTAGNSPGWLASTAGNNWDVPDPDTSGTISAAMLETIAPFCDTPEFALPGVSIPDPGSTIDGDIINPLATALGLDPDDFNFEVENEAEILLRLQREIATAQFGQRDALWALRRALGQAREFIYIEGPTFARTAYPGAVPESYEIDLVEVIRDRLENNLRLKVVLCLPRLPDFDLARDNWVRDAINRRNAAIQQLIAQAPNRVAAFHPIGFPGRSAAIRSTVTIVDDVWCMVGTSHLRRRGVTFDGAVDIVSFDREISRGYASQITGFRRALMAAKLGVEAPTLPSNASSLWIQLAQPESAFRAIRNLLQQGGLGRCIPIWGGPVDDSGEEQNTDLFDPNGASETALLGLLPALLLET